MQECAQKLGVSDPVALRLSLQRAVKNDFRRTMHVLGLSKAQYVSWMEKLPKEYPLEIGGITRSRLEIERRNMSQV